VRRGAAVPLALLVALVAAGAAIAAEELSLQGDRRETGWVRLELRAEPGVPVELGELNGGAPLLEPVVVREAETVFRRYARWSCNDRERRFVARQTGSDGVTREDTAVVRTPSCARRLALEAPRRLRAGGRGRLRIRDRWKLGGLEATVCTRAPAEPGRCRARRPGAFRYRALRAGEHLVTLRTPWQTSRRTIRALGRGGRLNVLATGDSMVQIIDSYLKQRIDSRRARVRSDARISTGLSKPSLLDWQAHARRQAASRPDAVVMFIGANDGFPMGDAACCGAAWIREYARRARRMMRTYAREGRARVYWLLLPAARGGTFRQVFAAVNAGLRRAAQGLAGDVRIVDLHEVFTPGGRYRDSMEVGGRVVRVRQPDGVHLNTTGASLAASIVIRALRRDRMLG
jgi:lysophospholipase L1-like esterase